MSVPIMRETGLAKISPEWEAFEKQFPIPPLLGTPEQLRQIRYPQDASLPIGFSIRDVKVPGYQGATNQVRLYTPDECSVPLPVVIYVHGGGWTIGDLDTEDKVCRTMCKSAAVIVVSVDYRKAPENPFPAGLEDAWEGVLWVFKNIDSLGGARDRVIIGGLSAGANIAAVLAQRARDVENVAFSGQVLRNPLVVHTDALPSDLDFSSYTENVNAPVLPTPAVTQCLNYYGAPPEDIRVSPLLATDLSGLPPAYIQIAGADPLRDDGFAYSERLHRAGLVNAREIAWVEPLGTMVANLGTRIPVKTSVYPGFPHAFMVFPLHSAQKSDEDLIKAIEWLTGTQN